MEKAIEARGISLYRQKKTILNVEEFVLHRREIMALIGPNGAGKSTFLQVLALLQRPSSGEIFVLGEQVTPRNELSLRRRMAVVFQEPLLLDASVYTNVASGLLLRGIERAEVEKRVSEWLGRLGIEHLARQPARTLSGGESQRVNLARAFALKPEILFLDEPFSALDYPTRKALIAELTVILKDTGISALLVTHDYHEIHPLAQRVAVMLDGRIVQCAPLEEIRRHPAGEGVAALVDP